MEEMAIDDVDLEQLNPTLKIDQAIDNSLNKSNLTMEDNNKVQKQKKSLPKDSILSMQHFEPPRISQGQLSIVQNEKVFELRRDDFNNDTSFDTLTSDRLFVTMTEESFPLSSQKQGRPSKIAPDGGMIDDYTIENELKKINKNLNTFTVEHFNSLRSNIQTFGFINASNKAKKEFNLVTGESLNTIQTEKEDENEFQITEESKTNNQFNQVYANQTTASKSLYVHKFEGKMLQNNSNAINDRESQHNGSSPILRKLIVCEQQTKRNHSVIEILFSVPCSGFNSAPSLMFSDKDSESRAFIEIASQSQNAIQKLMSHQALQSLIKTSVSWISCGFEHCLALTCFGQIASWGYGASGCLGHGDYVSYTQPKYLHQGDHHGQFLVYAEAGGYHNSALDVNGNLYMWGRCDVGQLGFEKETLLTDDLGLLQSTPRLQSYFNLIGKRVKQIALGEAHSLVLDQDGSVYSFGWGEHGQLGIGNNQDQKQGLISRIKFFDQFKCSKIASGSVFSAAITVMHQRVYIWGSGQNGQLGLGNIKSVDYPVFIDFLSNERIIDINCGDSHMIALCESGKVYGWGQGVTQSPTLMKNLRDSSLASQNFSNTGNKQLESMKRISSNFSQSQLDVICSLPKLLHEVDIAHTYLLKLKETQQQVLNQQVLQKAKQSLNPHTQQHIQTNNYRYLPSNHTICEVSERDSDIDEKSRIMRKNEIKSSLNTCQSSIIINPNKSSLSIPQSSLSKRQLESVMSSNQDFEYIQNIEIIQSHLLPKNKRAQSPPVQNCQIISQDTRSFGTKKGSLQFPQMQQMRLQTPTAQVSQNYMLNSQANIIIQGSQQTQTTQRKIKRDEIINKIEEFTQSHIQSQDKSEEKPKVKNEKSKQMIKNMNAQSSLGHRNQTKLHIQTTNSINQQSSKQFSNQSVIMSQIENSNNSSRISNRGSDKLKSHQQSTKSIASINKIKSPILNASTASNTKQAISPREHTKKKSPTPRNQMQVKNYQQYASQSVLTPSTAKGIIANNHSATTRNKNLQIKISTQNTLGSNSSFKKSVIHTTQHIDQPISTRNGPHILSSMMTPVSDHQHIGNNFSSTRPNPISMINSSSRSSPKMALNTQPVESKKHSKQSSLNSSSKVFVFNESTLPRPQGPKMGLCGSGQQFKAGIQSTKVSPKSNRNSKKNLSKFV